MTIVITTIAYRMPVTVALSAATLGMVTGLLLIGWIILSAIFLYNLVLESGQLEVIESSISSISPDRRLQALLIAFLFSAFMETTTGMGAPVAICAALLIGIGFPPLPAALVCLVGNCVPVPFGSLGVPTIMMASVSGISIGVLIRAEATNIAILALIIPIFMMVLLAGWEKALKVLPAALVAGGSYAVSCLLFSRLVAVGLIALLSSFVSLVCQSTFLKFWKPRSTYRFLGDPDFSIERVKKYSAGQIVRAWSPFIILLTAMGIWSFPVFTAWDLNVTKLVVNVRSWPLLDGIVYKTAPIVAKPSIYSASYRWEFGTTIGTAIFLSALISLAPLKIRPAAGAIVFFRTLQQMKFALVTLASVIGIAYVANYSGMSYTLALAMAHYTGKWFPSVSPVIGWLGVFLTGSVTSCAVLFGKLQQATAMQIGINPVLTTSANLAGSAAGKLISPQSLAVACAATGVASGDIFRKIWKYSVMLLLVVILLIVFEAYVFPGIVPTDASGLNS